MVMDLDLCVGCRGCEVACRQEHNLKPRIGEEINIRIKRIPYWTRVSTVGPSGVFPDLDMFYFPRMCNHCTDAPCVSACPTGAMTATPDGAVYIDHSRCIACLKCLDACPFNSIYYDKDDDTVSKCNLCIHLVENGMEPACVSTCMTRCRVFGDLNDPQSNVNRLLKEKKDYIMPLPVSWDSTAKPNVFYVRKKRK